MADTEKVIGSAVKKFTERLYTPKELDKQKILSLMQ